MDPNKSHGWTGKILRVNLTDKTVSVSPTDPYKEYLGGMGSSQQDHVRRRRFAGTRSASPENKIVFAVGL
ncbi:MAG: aldehyde ferredoxin oxidoreductase N-terminal domain-containing protein [Adlercreutzia equolifaciens]